MYWKQNKESFSRLQVKLLCDGDGGGDGGGDDGGYGGNMGGYGGLGIGNPGSYGGTNGGNFGRDARGGGSSSEGGLASLAEKVGRALGLTPEKESGIPKGASRVSSGDPTSSGFGATEEGISATIAEGLSNAAERQDLDLAKTIFDNLSLKERTKQYSNYTEKNTPKALSLGYNLVAPTIANLGLVQGIASALNALAGVPPGFHGERAEGDGRGDMPSSLTSEDLTAIVQNIKAENDGGIPASEIAQIEYLRNV